jgi:predicted glycoside hydrolase/deacetylase ChbG (UPF0249 family)
MTAKRCKLFITADDFGYCVQRNEGIVRAFRQGLVTGASMLVNMPEAESGAALAARHRLPLYLHLNLTEGKPLTAMPTTLVGDSGLMLGKLGFREAWHSKRVSADDIRREIGAQIDRFKTLVSGGDEVAVHCDGHQHVQVAPGLCQAIADELARRHVRSIRVAHERGSDAGELSPFLRAVQAHARDVRRDGVYRLVGLLETDDFVGCTLMGAQCTPRRVIDALRRALAANGGQCRSIEWMCHPGVPSKAEHSDEFARSKDRQRELDVLCSDGDDELRLFIDSHFQLSCFTTTQ